MSSTLELCSSQSEKKDLKKNGSENDERTTKLATTDLEATVHVVKASLGSGILAIPVAYKNAGIVEGFFGTIIVGLICTHGTHLLVKASQKMCAVLKKPSLGYAETVEAAFKTSPHSRLQSSSSIARAIVDLFLFLTYFGSNTVYVVIVASSLEEVVKNELSIIWDVRWFIVLCTIPLLIVGTIRSMKYLVPFSMLANVLLFIGLVITFYYVMQDLPPLDSRPYFEEITKFPLFFSTVISGLEGIGTILPIENSMRTPKHFLGCPGVLNVAMSIVVTLFTTVGFFGFLKYGDNVKGSITLNLPMDFTAELIKLLVALAVLFTFGLQMTAVMEVTWSRLQSRISHNNHNVGYYAVRASLVLATVLCAIAVPQLAPVISLIGAVGFSTLGLLIPATVDIILSSDTGLNLCSFNTWKNIIIMGLSIFALIAGSYTSIRDIIKEYK